MKYVGWVVVKFFLFFCLVCLLGQTNSLWGQWPVGDKIEINRNVLNLLDILSDLSKLPPGQRKKSFENLRQRVNQWGMDNRLSSQEKFSLLKFLDKNKEMINNLLQSAWDENKLNLEIYTGGKRSLAGLKVEENRGKISSTFIEEGTFNEGAYQEMNVQMLSLIGGGS